MEDKLLTICAVMAITGVCKTSIYQMIAAGQFPRQVKIGKRSRWSELAVRAWVKSKISGEDANDEK